MKCSFVNVDICMKVSNSQEHAKKLMDIDSMAIHPSLDKLRIALETATFDEFSLIKSRSQFNDVYDAFVMCCKYFTINEDQLSEWVQQQVTKNLLNNNNNEEVSITHERWH